ncbi:DUF6612 family protein [Halobacillus sp. K22]|uniref:DUF6612 family protein n=1 Tax=Halobacillus sp. K22 TaxID=3457431 RepID=UPI003FCD079A
MFKKLASLITVLLVVMLPIQVAAEEMSAEELFKKSNEAMMELDSYTVRSIMEQRMPMQGTEQIISTESKADITLDPFAMHQTVTTSLPESEELKLESYWTKEGFYQQNPEGGWVKFEEDFPMSQSDIKEMMSAQSQVTQASEFAEDMSVEEAEGSYVVSYEGDGEKLLKASQQLFQTSMDDEEMAKMMEEMMDQMTINELSYEVTIDKENHYMTGMMMKLDMDMEVEGNTTNMIQTFDMSIDNFNGVETITIPEQILDNAKSFEETIPEGGELPDTSSNDPALALAGASLAMIAGGIFVYRRQKTSRA